MKSQFGTSSWGGTPYTPMVFTEQGVAMKSSVLKSKIAIEVNVKIMRIFVKMRELMVTHKEILLKLDRIEEKLRLHENKHNKSESEIEIVFKAIKQLLEKPKTPMKRIGFKERD